MKVNNLIKSGVQVSKDTQPTLKRGKRSPIIKKGYIITALRGLKGSIVGIGCC